MHLHFHLGPVGGFIAEARRTRDFWAGSFLLSRLSGAAMAAVRRHRGEVLLPVVERMKGGATVRDKMLDSILDPAAAAEKRPFFGSLSNHFLADFNRKEDAEAAGAAAEKAVAETWFAIGEAVRVDLLEEFAFAGAERARIANAIWRRQIGDGSTAPFFECYWIASREEKKAGPSWPGMLDRRKMTRWSIGPAAAPADDVPEGGNFCTMFPGLVDVSGLERRRDRDAFRSFWKGFREHLNRKRYPSTRHGLDPDACLDLRPNESLCAPALVKRLFPLLGIVSEEGLKRSVGWVPELRNAMPAMFADPGALQRFLARFGFRTKPGERMPDLLAGPSVEDRQSLQNWPSVTYIAATHWIARAQGAAIQECLALERAVRRFGIQYALAESPLWLRAVQECEFIPLAAVDGAMFHRNRVLATPGDDASRKEVVAALGNLQNHAYGPEAAKLGAPGSLFAIIRADGDRVGKTLSTAGKKARDAISGLFLDWADALSGARGAQDIEARLGPVAARNGILLYAGADEVFILSPPEDALDIAFSLQSTFAAEKEKALAPLRQAAGRDRNKIDELVAPVESVTLSASILYCNVRAPLRWAIRESAALLDDAAKEDAGRNALAVALFDIDGVRSPFAAPWSSRQSEAFRTILASGTGDLPRIASNEFFHRLGERLKPFLVPSDRQGYGEACAWIRSSIERSADDFPKQPDRAMAEAVIARSVREAGGDGALATSLGSLLTPHVHGLGADAHGAFRMAPLDVLRVVAGNWRKSSAARTKALEMSS